jgi:hypothetical protein
VVKQGDSGPTRALSRGDSTAEVAETRESFAGRRTISTSLRTNASRGQLTSRDDVASNGQPRLTATGRFSMAADRNLRLLPRTVRQSAMHPDTATHGIHRLSRRVGPDRCAPPDLRHLQFGGGWELPHSDADRDVALTVSSDTPGETSRDVTYPPLRHVIQGVQLLGLPGQSAGKSREGHAMTVRRFGRILVGSVVLSAATMGVGATVAGASPSNAPTALSGSFFGCSNGASGTFVINSGKAAAPTTWTAAHLTFASGERGIFISTALDLTFTFDGQSFSDHFTKGSAPGSVTCSIFAEMGDATLSGTVTGTVVLNG